MFKAMYDSAVRCGLPPSAQRYVSAAIYASTIKVRALTEDKQARRDELANALERLATTWVAYMLWPCRFTFPSGPHLLILGFLVQFSPRPRCGQPKTYQKWRLQRYRIQPRYSGLAAHQITDIKISGHL